MTYLSGISGARVLGRSQTDYKWKEAATFHIWLVRGILESLLVTGGPCSHQRIIEQTQNCNLKLMNILRTKNPNKKYCINNDESQSNPIAKERI